MKIVVITLFPEMFDGVLTQSILGRAKEKGLLAVEFVNLRDFGIGPRKQVDDTPYGGGAGMVLRVDVMAAAVAAAKLKIENSKKFFTHFFFKLRINLILFIEYSLFYLRINLFRI